MPRQTRPPDDFDDEARGLWIAAQHQLRRQGTWCGTDGPLLEQLVRNLVLARESRRHAEQSPFVPGSAGQLTAHPGLKVAAEAEAAALRAANALLLTPESRARHNIGAGAAQPDDELAAIVG